MVDIADCVKFRGLAVYERYYNESSMWGVFNVRTTDELEYSRPITADDVKFEMQFDPDGQQYSIVTVAGNMQHLSIGAEYEFVATPNYNKKYDSWQYAPKQVTSVAPKSAEDTRIFLRSLLSENQTNTLLSVYPDIVNQIMQGTDNVDLSKLKGIKEKTYASIKEKVLDNFVISDIITILQPAGISYEAIMALLRQEENPNILKSKIMDNPYCLTRLKGYGFKRVDDIALKLKPELRDSNQRVYAFLKYYFNNKAEGDGDTWVDIDVLDSEIANVMPECFDRYNDILKNETKDGLFLCGENGHIGLRYYRRVEESVVNILNGLNQYEFKTEIADADIENGIKITEDELGFTLTDEQFAAVNGAFTNNVMLLTGNAGCVDADTEFFNGREWKKISEWNTDDKVLQWNRDGTAELVKPNAYIKKPCDHLWHIQTKYGVDQCLSDDHNMCWFSAKGAFHECTALEAKQMQETTCTGFPGRFATSFTYNGSGIDISDDILRLYVAVIADGSFNYTLPSTASTYNQVRFHIKKERKKERLRKLLNESGLPHREAPNAMEWYADFYCSLPFRTKEFPSSWYNCSQHQLRILADELPYWDGTFSKGNRLWNISTTSKHNADFIQFVYSSIGYRASINVNDRVGQQYLTCGKLYTRKSIEYSVCATKRTLVGVSRPSDAGETTRFKKFIPEDGYQYCFNVPSHYLVLRRNSKIFVTGNCGKSSISRAILNIYRNKSCSVSAASFSAKAAQRITEATGFPATTIHRLLGVDPKTGRFVHNEELPLESDVVFIDEASMLNVELLYDLLKAVKPGSRVIFVGDKAQLPPIGAGAPFADLMDMRESFATYALQTVHRQAAKSGILTDANMIRKGEFPINEPSVKITSGELHDMTYCFRDDRENMQAIAIKRFLKAVEQDGIDNVVLIVPRKKNCPNSTEEINRIIQDELIPESAKSIKYGDKVFRLGAKVIQTVNNYEKMVVNGEIGYIYDLDPRAPKEEECLVVKYDDNKFVGYTKEQLNQISLAYCLTCHRFQGSQAKSVIVVIDNSHYKLLSREWAYTAITRAQKRCLLIAEPNAFSRCIRTKVSRRKTWMSLMEEYT